MTDDGGVLGNLPNSRPGKRSAKREAGAGTPAKAAAKAAAKAERKDAPAAKPAAKRRRTAPVKGGDPGDRVGVNPDMRGERIHDPVPPPAAEDPVGAVVRTGLGIAETGVRVAGALSRELFKRLPRP